VDDVALVAEVMGPAEALIVQAARAAQAAAATAEEPAAREMTLAEKW
jgi:hypothetical protein